MVRLVFLQGFRLDPSLHTQRTRAAPSATARCRKPVIVTVARTRVGLAKRDAPRQACRFVRVSANTTSPIDRASTRVRIVRSRQRPPLDGGDGGALSSLPAVKPLDFDATNSARRPVPAAVPRSRLQAKGMWGAPPGTSARPRRSCCRSIDLTDSPRSAHSRPCTVQWQLLIGGALPDYVGGLAGPAREHPRCNPSHQYAPGLTPAQHASESGGGPGPGTDIAAALQQGTRNRDDWRPHR